MFISIEKLSLIPINTIMVGTKSAIIMQNYCVLKEAYDSASVFV